MASSLDQSLDDIISSKPRNRGIRKRRGLRLNRAAANAAVTRKQAAAPAVVAPKAPASAPKIASSDLFDQGSKIIPFDVTEQQIKDLFNVQIGQVARVTLTYGPNGTSKGIATIQFRNQGDAKKAFDRYDGKLIDNSRRLKIEIILDPTRVKPNLAQRIQNTPLVSVAPAPRAARGGRGRGRRGRGGLRGTGRRPKKTVDELDAEMTDYFQDNGTVATTTA